MSLLKRLRCKHDGELRCVHGDEINFLGGARAVCQGCGKALKNEALPKICWYTGKLHWGARAL